MRFNGRFFALPFGVLIFGGAYVWRGLFSEFLRYNVRVTEVGVPVSLFVLIWYWKTFYESVFLRFFAIWFLYNRHTFLST